MNLISLLKIVNEENCGAKIKAMQLKSFKDKELIDVPEAVAGLIDDIVEHLDKSSKAMFNELDK